MMTQNGGDQYEFDRLVDGGENQANEVEEGAKRVGEDINTLVGPFAERYTEVVH